MTNISTSNVYRDRVDFAKIHTSIPIPNLIEVQRKSYHRFLQMDVPSPEREDVGLQAVFNSVFPINDFRGTSSLEFVEYSIGNWQCKCGNLKGLNYLRANCAECGKAIINSPYNPDAGTCRHCGGKNEIENPRCEFCGGTVDLNVKYSVEECQERGMTFAVPLKVTVRLVVWDKDAETEGKSVRDIKEQEVYFGDIPLMTENGTFIVNGTERVIVSQLHRSPGVFFESSAGHTFFLAKIIPYRGSWVEFEYDQKNLLYVRIDRKRKFLATTFLRALGLSDDAGILRTFYTPVTIRWEDNVLYRGLGRDLVGSRAAEDIKDPKGKSVLVAKGKKILAGAYNQLVKAGVKEIVIDMDALEGALSISEVINQETGEILVESNTEVTSRTIAVLAENGISSLEVFYPEREDTGVTISQTLRKDHIKSQSDALIEIYRKQRPGDPPTIETATALFEGMFYDPRKYDFSKVGRLKFNIKLGLNTPLEQRTLQAEDFYAVISYALKLPRNIGTVDDIDHLGNRRVRAVGELLENQFRIGLVRMERAIKEKKSVHQEMTTAMPHDLINAKPVMASIRNFSAAASCPSSWTRPTHFRDHPQAAPVGPGAGRVEPRAGGVRGARRAPDPLRPHLPHRNAGRPQHRADLLAQLLRPDQRVRLHRVSLPQGKERQGAGIRSDRVPGGHPPQGGRTIGKGSRGQGKPAVRGVGEAPGPVGTAFLLSDRLGGRGVQHRPGERRHRRGRDADPGAGQRPQRGEFRPGRARGGGLHRRVAQAAGERGRQPDPVSRA
jgi:DNA-directed RNA polymerase subunit beta